MGYNDIPEATTALLMSFPGSFINGRNEFIADKRSNQYFILRDCRQPKDIDCKILEWLSRSASKGSPCNIAKGCEVDEKKCKSSSINDGNNNGPYRMWRETGNRWA